MKLLSSITSLFIQQLIYSSASLLMGLTSLLYTHPVLAQSGGSYATPGLYTYTVPTGGPYQIRLTARGGDGGGSGANGGGSGASVGATFTVQSGDVLTMIVGQSGGPITPILNGGGGGGSAVVLTRNGTPTLLVAAGGGGGAGSQSNTQATANYPGGGGQGLGPGTGGTGGPSGGNYSGSGGGGGLTGPGGMGAAGFNPGGGGGAAASLTAVSAGGMGGGATGGYGGSGFGGGGAVGGYDSSSPQAAGGGGGGYGGGNGAGAFNTPQNVLNAQGGYSYVSPTGSVTMVSPGTSGSSQNQDGKVALTFPNNTATAAITTTSQSACSGSPVTLQGTVSATGSWTLVLSDGSIGTGSGVSFSIPVSPVISTTYTIQSLTDQRGFANSNNLTGSTTITTNRPTVSLSSNGPLTCALPSVTLTATSNATSYTFSSGGTILAGDNTSNTRFVSTPGDYVVRVSGVGSCTNSATITVTQQLPSPPSLTLTSAGTLTCDQPTATLVTLGISNAANPIVSYTFTYGNTVLPGDPSSNRRTVSEPGEYRVQVTGANSCTASGTTVVSQGNVTPPVLYALLDDGPLSCAKPYVKMTVLAGGTSQLYKFIGEGISQDRFSTLDFEFASRPGTYTVVALNSANGCTKVATTTISQVGNTITNPATTSFLVDQGVRVEFLASNGVAPYSSFSVVSGSLPPGLSLLNSPTDRGLLTGTPTQAGSYTVVIQASDANDCTGRGAPYIMNVAPFAITSQPENKSVCPASPVTVSVGIVGRPTAYQWYKNDPSGIPAIVPGQTAATLSLASVRPSDGGSYVVVITGGGLSLTSTAATLTILSSSPARFYVNANARGANTGLDWGNAFTNLQSALQSSYQCLTALREIWVAGGLYKPTTTNDRTSVFVMLPDVAIYGGFVGHETTLSQRAPLNPITGHPSSSTLSGDIGQPGDASDNSQTIVGSYNLGSTAVLDGFVITGSKSDNNTNALVGGSLMNIASNGSSPTLTNLLFINNNSGSLGGAILNYANGGDCNPIITNCLFQHNTAVNAGGAIANYGSNGNVNPVITNCLFQNNTANWGGAIFTFAYGTTSSPVITNCSFQSNSATTQGGALWNVTQQNGNINPTLTNCSFQVNSAPEGGAVYNSAASDGATVRLSMANDVLFDNGGANSISNAGDATLSASYSLFDASVTGYTNVAGNLTTASSPFANATGTQLKTGSPAINAGNNQAYQTASGPPTDLAGNTRIQQTTIDMGAYEAGSTAPTSDLTLILFAQPSTVYGQTAINVVVNVYELNSVATQGLFIVKLSEDAMLNLSFDPTATSVGGKPVQNRFWSFSGPVDGMYTVTPNQPIAAGGVLSFGLSGNLTPGPTKGKMTVSATVLGIGLVENQQTNNTDAESIDYFNK